MSTANTMLSNAQPPIALSPEQQTLLQKSRNPKRCAEIILLMGLKSPISQKIFENIYKRPKNIETVLKKIQALGLQGEIKHVKVDTLQNLTTYGENLTKIDQYLTENSPEHRKIFSLHPPGFNESQDIVKIMNNNQIKKMDKISLIQKVLDNTEVSPVHIPSSLPLGVNTVSQSTAPTEGLNSPSNRPKKS